MNIEYQLTRNEYREFLKLTYKRIALIGKGSTKFTALNLVAYVLIGLALAAIVRFYEVYGWIDFHHLNLALTFLGIGIACLFAVSMYQRWFFMRYSIDEEGYLLQKHNASITEDTIVVTTGDIHASYSWGSFQGRECSDNLVCLYIDNGQGVIFPKRAFQDEAQFEEFTSLFDSKTQ